MTRHTTHIDVGVHEDKVGFSLHYDDGDIEHFLFTPAIARSLASKLLKVIEEIEYIERQTAPGDHVQVNEHVDIRVTPPATED